MHAAKDQWGEKSQNEICFMNCFSLYLFPTFCTCFNCHITCLLQLSSLPKTLPCCYVSHFFWLFQHCVLIRSTGQSGSEETALVIIHLSIFSHALLHYSHPSICTAIHVCHSNELRLASPVITTWAVLPFPTASSALYWEKFPSDVIFKSLTALSLFIFSPYQQMNDEKAQGHGIKTMNKKVSFVSSPMGVLWSTTCSRLRPSL